MDGCVAVAVAVAETHQAEITYFLIFGFVVSTNSTQIKDGGLSFGDFYITGSWEEDYSAPGWILAHHWQDPGRFFLILHQNNIFPKEIFIFHEKHCSGRSIGLDRAHIQPESIPPCPGGLWDASWTLTPSPPQNKKHQQGMKH